MRGHQKSQPNLRFLQPQLTARQPSIKRNDSIKIKYDQQKTQRSIQTETSLSIDKIYQITPLLNNIKTPKVFRQNFIQKTEPSEISIDKTNQDPPLSRKQTAKLIYRPINKNNEIIQKKETYNEPMYYLTELIAAHEGKENYFNRVYRDHFQQSFLAFKQCMSAKIIYKPKPIILPKDPKDNKKYTLLFDLDETLVHCTLDMKLPCDKRLTVKLQADEILQIGLTIRPGLQSMLEMLEPNFEIIVFTASHGQYAKKIVEYIDPRKIISKVLSREHCCFTDQGQYVKDISIIKNRALSKTVLIDNSAFSYYFQLDNGIPIIPFYDNKLDKQLGSLTKYLNCMLGCDDVREYNQKNLKTFLLAKLGTPDQVLDMYKVFINRKN